jgi:hypothetical protein
VVSAIAGYCSANICRKRVSRGYSRPLFRTLTDARLQQRSKRKLRTLPRTGATSLLYACALSEDRASGLPIGEFPLLRGLAPVLADYDGAAELERGLDILLKGVSGILTR